MSYKITENCIGCTICARNCQFGAIEGTLKSPHKVNAACTGCGVCAQLCKFGALSTEAK